MNSVVAGFTSAVGRLPTGGKDIHYVSEKSKIAGITGFAFFVKQVYER